MSALVTLAAVPEDLAWVSVLTECGQAAGVVGVAMVADPHGLPAPQYVLGADIFRGIDVVESPARPP